VSVVYPAPIGVGRTDARGFGARRFVLAANGVTKGARLLRVALLPEHAELAGSDSPLGTSPNGLHFPCRNQKRCAFTPRPGYGEAAANAGCPTPTTGRRPRVKEETSSYLRRPCRSSGPSSIDLLHPFCHDDGKAVREHDPLVRRRQGVRMRPPAKANRTSHLRSEGIPHNLEESLANDSTRCPLPEPLTTQACAWMGG